MMDEPRTICVECRHHRKGGGTDMWYDHYCSARPREEERDPVTGKRGYESRNDLGNLNSTDEQYPHCRSINHGDCQDYEAK